MKVYEWTHNICEDCWNQRNPNREPVRLAPLVTVRNTCFCGTVNFAGIFVRDKPYQPFCREGEEDA